MTANLASAEDAALMTLAPAHFRETALVKDDPVAGLTTVSTEEGYVHHHGPLRAVWNDEYLYAIVDRGAQRKTFKVIVTVTYRGSRRRYENVRFRDKNAMVTVPTVQIKTTSVNCPTGECTYTDQLEFPLEEDLLRQLAVAADPPQLWHFTLLQRGGDYTGELSTAEIAGFLAKVDEYTGAAPRPPPPSAGKRELGIGGLRAEASPQHPSRSGVLVTAVVPGSLAEGAGIIVGDIVVEFAGHAIKVPGDLESALASSPANAELIFKIYRGTEQMTLKGHL